MPRFVCVTLLIALLVAGCGSKNTAQSSVSNMKNVIQSYNESHPGSLAATGDTCRTAYDDLGKNPAILTDTLGTGHAAEQRLLRSAYRSARVGFKQCFVGASSLSFPTMAAAEVALESANTSIAQAQRLEH